MKKLAAGHGTRPFKLPHRFLHPLMAGLVFGVIGVVILISVFAEEPQEAVFQVHCSVNHTSKDDPIVFPNQPGKSHMHSFLGNTTTNAATTGDSLMASRSNCARNMETSDRSAYWIPSIYKRLPDGTLQLAPTRDQIAFIYYQRPGMSNGPEVRAFPNGLRMIAGNPNATSANPQPLSVVRWGCGGGGGGPQTSHMPNCPDPSQPLHGSVIFPSCWNGRDLDSPDHKSHMAYADTGGNCPSTHPVSLPELFIELDFIGIPGGPSYELSSGGQYSMHADFFSAWEPRVMNALVAECLNIPRTCTGITKEGNTLFKPAGDPDGSIPPINIMNYPDTLPVASNPPPAPLPAPTPTPTPGQTPTPPPSSGKLGDINGDNQVNINDLSLLLVRWGQNYAPADFNNDGIVNLSDLSIFLGRWNT